MRVDGADLLVRLAPAEPRHHHVEDDQVARVGVRAVERHGLDPVGGDQHRVAQPLQDLLGERPQHRLVLGDQDGLMAAAHVARRRRRVDDLPRLLGQEDAKRGALAGLRLDLEKPPVLLDDAVDHGQPETGAPAHLLGGEERLEDASARLVTHARAGVTHLEPDVAPGLGARVARERRLVEVDGTRLEGEQPAVGHGVAGIDGEVHHHLLDLGRIGEDQRQVRSRVDDHLDVLTDDPLDELHHVGERLVEVDEAAVELLPAPEGEQLPGEHGGATTGEPDVLDARPQLALGRQLAGDHVARAHDDGEQVVEVVRDAARERPDRLHLLRLTELLLADGEGLLGGELRGDVAVDAEHGAATAKLDHR